MRHVTRTQLGGREHLHVSVVGAGRSDLAAEAREVMESALRLIEDAGYARSSLVRSRLFARDANARRIASDLRVALLSGDLRAASSSYIDPARLPDGANVAVDLVAVRAPAGAGKIVKEYDPVIAPPMFVRVADMVYVSGCTDTSDGFEAQFANIRGNITRNLQAAGAALSDVISVSAHVSRKVDANLAWSRVTGMFPHPRCAVSLSQVDGYSAPEKLIEIETAAQLA